MLAFKEIIKEPPIIGFDYDVTGMDTSYEREEVSDPSSHGYSHEHQQLRRVFHGESKEFNKFKSALIDSIPSMVETFIRMDQQQKVSPHRWPAHEVDNIAKRIRLQLLPVIDMPGFKLGSHIDQRSWFATGLLNVSDNVSVTRFTKKRKSLITPCYYKAEGRAGKGVLWLNTESTWHHMERVPHERKIIQINFLLI